MRVFGPTTVRRPDGRATPTHLLGAQQVLHGLGRPPTLEGCSRKLPPDGCMIRAGYKLSTELAAKDLNNCA